MVAYTSSAHLLPHYEEGASMDESKSFYVCLFWMRTATSAELLVDDAITSIGGLLERKMEDSYFTYLFICLFYYQVN